MAADDGNLLGPDAAARTAPGRPDEGKAPEAAGEAALAMTQIAAAATRLTGRRGAVTTLFALGMLAAAALPAAAREERVNAEGGVAIRGYDPVAYFTEGRPVRGRAEFPHAWRGATWQFASAEHRDRFAAEPARYAPAYGGHCAWAASENYLAPIDPQAWRIVDGRLFLNYDRSVQRRWERDIPERITRGDRNWSSGLAWR
jgi:hypothetical protein